MVQLNLTSQESEILITLLTNSQKYAKTRQEHLTGLVKDSKNNNQVDTHLIDAVDSLKRLRETEIEMAETLISRIQEENH